MRRILAIALSFLAFSFLSATSNAQQANDQFQMQGQSNDRQNGREHQGRGGNRGERRDHFDRNNGVGEHGNVSGQGLNEGAHHVIRENNNERAIIDRNEGRIGRNIERQGQRFERREVGRNFQPGYTTRDGFTNDFNGVRVREWNQYNALQAWDGNRTWDRNRAWDRNAWNSRYYYDQRLRNERGFGWNWPNNSYRNYNYNARPYYEYARECSLSGCSANRIRELIGYYERANPVYAEELREYYEREFRGQEFGGREFVGERRFVNERRHKSRRGELLHHRERRVPTERKEKL